MSKSIHQAVPLQRAEQAADSRGLDTSMPLHNRTDAPHSARSLSALHQRTVALQLSLGGRDQTLRGHGVYERDPDLGSVLRIELPADAGCEFVIVEDSWSGEIESGNDLGCDFLIRLI